MASETLERGGSWQRLVSFAEHWQQVFQLDLRSLAALRIALALVALLDVFYYRWPHAELLLSDRGVLPLELFAQLYDPSYWSVYRWNGDLGIVRLLLLIQAAAAIAFLIGWRTGWANVILLVLCWSVQARNPLTNTGGDVLLRNLLAWCCLLPMSARWSLDARRRTLAGAGSMAGNRGAESLYSLATMGLILQLVVMYFCAGLAKCNRDWFSGEALAYCLQLELYLKPPGQWLQAVPSVLPLITWATVAMELAAPLFLLTPWRTVSCRMVMLLCYWAFHWGIGMVYSIGIFSIAASAAWLMLIPGSLWDWMGLQSPRESAGGYSADKPVHQLPAQEKQIEGQGWLNWLASAMLGFMLLINLANALPKDAAPAVARGLHELGRWTMFAQEYTMFGEPPKENSFYAFDAELENGERVDLFSGGPPNFEPTKDELYRWGRAQPWRRLLTNVSPGHDQQLSAAGRRAFALLQARILEALVGHWNRNHAAGERVKVADFLYFQRKIDPAGAVPVPGRIRWARWPSESSE
ncbi:MAG: HTTM domain-containing protein [Planctomycetota bacterium]|jgi:hypothetical protein